MDQVKILYNQKLFKCVCITILGTLILTISAKIKIPFYPVPMTMQTFVVVFLGLAFGYKIALSTVVLYLVEGIFGLPVFSNSPEKGIGLVYFTGPTMGYLIGFLFAAFFSGFLNFNKNLIVIFLKIVFTISFIYLLGMLWLGILIGWDKPIFELGALPFLYAELFKIMLLTVICKKILKLRSFI